MGKCAKGELEHAENPGWTSPEILSIVNRKHMRRGGNRLVLHVCLNAVVALLLSAVKN